MIQMVQSRVRMYTCKLCKHAFPAAQGTFFKSSTVHGGEDFQCAVCCAWEGEPTAVTGNIHTEMVVLRAQNAP